MIVRPFVGLVLAAPLLCSCLVDLERGAAALAPTDPIPPDTEPCSAPQYWPLTLQSTSYPIDVHYRSADERAAADEVLGLLERSWRVEVEELGFTAPLRDVLPDGRFVCGQDDDFDVFIWRGYEKGDVNPLDENPATYWNDVFSYMQIDPWGPYGGAIMDSTIAHEFNHACHAADDWYDAPVVFEMTATFIEDAVFPEDNQYLNQVKDFQDRPDWALDHDDAYDTWFMYGSALYLHFLSDRFFDGDPAFAAEMWTRMRNPAGAEDDPNANEPDFEDALDEILRRKLGARMPAGESFLRSVVEFARWRWFTGDRADGRHFREDAPIPTPRALASVPLAPARVPLDPAPMMLGSAYVELVRGPADPPAIQVGLEGASSAVRWVVQAVPGADGSDGEVLDLSTGPAVVRFPPDLPRRTIVVTALPPAGRPRDPDADQQIATHGATLVLTTPAAGS